MRHWRTIGEGGIVDYEFKGLLSNDTANSPKNAGILYKQAFNMLSPDVNKPPRLKHKPRLKLTSYKLLQIIVILVSVGKKALEMLRNGTVSTTWLEVASSSITGAGLYWLGRYECAQPPIASWFFHRDYLPDLLYVLLMSQIVGSAIAIHTVAFWCIQTAFKATSNHIFPNKPLLNNDGSEGGVLLQWAFTILLWFPFLILGYMVAVCLVAIAAVTLVYFHTIFMMVPVYSCAYRPATRNVRHRRPPVHQGTPRVRQVHRGGCVTYTIGAPGRPRPLSCTSFTKEIRVE